MTRLHYQLLGDGQPVVFLHAFPFDSRMWSGQVNALAQHHYTCVALDFSGFGRSLSDGSQGQGHAIEDHAYDVLELVDHLHFDKVHMVGSSMGGYVALAFARRYPQRLASLVLANSKAEPDGADAKANRDKGVQLIESKGPGAFLDGLLPKLMSRNAPPGLVAQIRGIAESQPQSTLIGALLAMRNRADATDVLRELDVPCLLVGAEGDAIMPPDVTKAMKDVQPDADLAILKGSSHLAPVESADVFNTTLMRFFESLRH